MSSSAPASAGRRAYLRTVSLGVPGLLLSGWAPATASLRSVGIAVTRPGGATSPALQAGVDLGVQDVEQAARLLGVRLEISRDDAASLAPDTIPVVVRDDDGPASWNGAAPGGPRIHTCRLTRWRDGAWSVASAPRQGGQVVDWHHGLQAHGAAALNARFARVTGRPMDEQAWRGWMAVKVAFDVALRAAAGEHDMRALRFDGHKGQPLRFSEDGHLLQPTYAAGPRLHA